ncbi:hypothetical protein CAPTEDRAFT_203796 [Capitella teleta]|uniref:Major facilitator superfamily (MFS) profile domain-containing protein n=1 Tax=Capitella teleta TaxID=283909 RepID=R7UAJ6_CAPTE|nr:hypothetical protein CAPTEDRAFT_203796 [Capitella teleta]|eukprot:ELU02979.1 hypothetical protein CAPTEDRAFT_203796 [Capitella teleta]
MSEESLSSRETYSPVCCYNTVRQSPVTTIVIVFFALVLDFMLVTLLEPILPDILAKLDEIDLSDVSSREEVLDVINQNGRYGYLVAAKGAAQFVLNPVIGILVSRIGCRKPMLVGTFGLMISTVCFAFSQNYAELFVTRIFQGLSSAITAVTGMALLASSYAKDEERSRAMAISFGGISCGITGPVYGSLVYEFVGQRAPFFILATAAGGVIILQLFAMQPEAPLQHTSPVSAFIRLLCDPMILIVVGNLLLLNLHFALLLAFLPLRMIQLNYTETWQLGLAILPVSVGYLVMCAGSIKLYSIPKWIRCFSGLAISVPTLIMIAYLNTLTNVIITATLVGASMGLVTTAAQPILANLVEVRHESIYGCVYALSDMSVCLAFFVGPLIGGVVIYEFSFEWLIWGTALVTAVFSCFSFFLRSKSIEQQIRTWLSGSVASETHVFAVAGSPQLSTEPGGLTSARRQGDGVNDHVITPDHNVKAELSKQHKLNCPWIVQDENLSEESLLVGRTP